LQTYGPEGTARVQSTSDVGAVTYRELKAWLQASGTVATEDTPVLVAPLSAERLAEVESQLSTADWLVFAMRDVRPSEAPGSDALKLFLKSNPPQTGDARLVGIALGAPYYLDTTEIDKLTSYYAVYSHIEPFLDVALNAIFGDEAPAGASPVSVPGAGYELEKRLEPDPDQTVTLELVGRNPAAPIAQGEPITVRSSLVRDLNGNTAPDGTLVTFRRYDRAEDVFLPDVPAATVLGRATSTMRAERGGELVLTAVFENGLRSEPLVLDIEGAAASAAGELVLPEVPFPAIVERSSVPVDWGILTLSLTLILLAGVLFYGVEGGEGSGRSTVSRTRLFLLVMAWGLAGYLLVAAGGLQLAALPGGSRLWPRGWSPAYQAPLIAFVFALLPVVPSLWRAVSVRRRE
jgi:beta-N-acetylhexosaminidase